MLQKKLASVASLLDEMAVQFVVPLLNGKCTYVCMLVCVCGGKG